MDKIRNFEEKSFHKIIITQCVLIHISDTAANSQDGSSLELVTASAECNIQDARGGRLCLLRRLQAQTLPDQAPP